jgi:hypothetical protein
MNDLIVISLAEIRKIACRNLIKIQKDMTVFILSQKEKLHPCNFS